jgi:hypothetical protein
MLGVILAFSGGIEPHAFHPPLRTRLEDGWRDRENIILIYTKQRPRSYPLNDRDKISYEQKLL